eukprot:CAMPEP_0119301026 /NCGR_PEP_ID=MMETSP1333-20130426/2890_1 /TAXON_ID=418940 /ORGANISM="Scyphosphaera apsteinii, Strain RCC1455" /LENGTH=226 /DNA_ID=CAMNT_0007302997 /DNA_START=54 /DNA_END=734 /DNA_ORIENTATION=+
MSDSNENLALPAPRVDIDALPYVDTQFNDPAIKAQVDRLIQDELSTIKKQPRDYLAHLPLYEPKFEGHPALQAEWMRICSSDGKEPMPTMDVSRYQLDPPPQAKQTNAAAWDRAVHNAEAQLEHQSNRIDNLELMQKYGANLWRVHLNSLEAASRRLESEQAELSQQIDTLNRKRKLEQNDVGPKLQRLEAEWVNAVKKNLEIEGAVARLEAECSMMRRQLDPTAQ